MAVEVDRLFRILFFHALLDNCARPKVPVMPPPHRAIRSLTRTALSQFLSRNAIRALAAKPRRGLEIVAGGASPRIGYCIYGAPAGRKAFLRNIFLSPLQGSALFSDPTPGLRPGLLSCRPSGASLKGGANFAMETDQAPFQSDSGSCRCACRSPTHFTGFGNMRARISFSNLAATLAVMPEGSSEGFSSTMSAPTISACTF